MADVDVVVVGYRPGPETERALSDARTLGSMAREVHYFDNTGNPKSLSAAWNDLAGEGRAPRIAFLNSDVALCPGWDERLARILDSRPEVGAVLPRPVGGGKFALDGREFRVGDPPSEAEMAEVAAWALEASWGALYDFGCECPPFYAVMVRRPEFEALRGFDERLRFYAQDHEMQERMRARGQKIVRADFCPVYHGGSVATRRACAAGDLDINAEYEYFGKVLHRLRSGGAPRWHELDDAGRAAVRADPACSMRSRA